MFMSKNSQILLPVSWSISIVSFVGLFFATIIVFFPELYLSVLYSESVDSMSKQIKTQLGEEVFAQYLPVQEQISPGLPVRLKIPKIKVNIALEQVGLTRGGAVGVPKGIANGAWFNLSVRPGDSGSAVITGHYGRWKDGSGSVFDNINKLRKGDKIYVEDEKGETITFIVRESRRFDPKADAVSVFNSNDEKSHLNLITCEGSWVNATKTYTKRLVVFADKE